MRDFGSFFKGKRITLMGLGLLGRGVGDAEFLARYASELIVSDLKSEQELEASLLRLKNFSNIHYTLGKHDLEDFKNRDLILKAAGVLLDSPYIAEAKKNGIPVRMSADLLMELSKVKTIGVTGTRGKSTVAHMIAHALKRAGKHVILAGNIRGVSNLQLLTEVREDSLLVLELDSWQLQGFGEAKISPHIAVFTNFMQDHFNYYKGDEKTYFSDKANIFRFQKAGDTLIAGEGIIERVRKEKPPRVPIVPLPLPLDWKLKILGTHNRENAALAAQALRAAGLSDEEIKEGLGSFEGVEGRLQFVREINGIRIYNDNNATTPEATIAALKALDGGKKNIILIMGGADKGLDMSSLWKEIMTRCKDLYFLSGTGIDRIRPQAPHVPVYDSLEEALREAFKGASTGDFILFSPAFASFGLFKNEYDRNDQFMELVKNL